MKDQQQIKSWDKYRQEGKEKYVQKRSLLIAASILIGQSVARLLKGDLTFFEFSNLSLIFVVTYIAALIGTTSNWKRNEKKYNTYVNDIKE